MAKFPVSTQKEQALQEKMRQLGICEEDLEEQFIRSSGPGGQNVNKVSSCVTLVHQPSGLSVRCQEARSQGLNRYLARQRLAEKMEEKVLGAASKRQKEIEKIRRQKRKRSKRSKERLLRLKHLRAETKGNRKPVGAGD